MIRDSLISIIEEVIKSIERDYQRAQGLILTEDDLKSVIYHKLSRYPEFSEPRATRDRHVLAPSLHTELSWYDENDKLAIQPDISILDQRNLSILRGHGDAVKLPSKQYSFTGDAILLELKFIRNKSGIQDQTVRSKLRPDYEKIQRLYTRLNIQEYQYMIFCYFVVFNKTDIKCEEFDCLMEEINSSERCKLIYASGHVRFPHSSN